MMGRRWAKLRWVILQALNWWANGVGRLCVASWWADWWAEVGEMVVGDTAVDEMVGGRHTELLRG